MTVTILNYWHVKVGDNSLEITPPPGENLLRRVYFTDFLYFFIIAIPLDFWCYFTRLYDWLCC